MGKNEDSRVVVGGTVLFVDDDRLQRTVADKVVRPIVESRGLTFASASNIEEAKAVAAQAGPLLVLTDHNMPGGSGVDLANALDGQARVIVMTASAGSHLHTAAAQAGVAEVVEKPFGLDAYEALAQRLLDDWHEILV